MELIRIIFQEFLYGALIEDQISCQLNGNAFKGEGAFAALAEFKESCELLGSGQDILGFITGVPGGIRETAVDRGLGKVDLGLGMFGNDGFTRGFRLEAQIGDHGEVEEN